MKILNLKLSDIKPYEKNPRKNDNAVQYVAESIRQFGFKVPVVIDGENIIVAGHTRYKAAKQLGIDEVPCIVADDLTPEQVKAFRLADNKVAEQAGWDFDLLGGELDEIFNFDMSEFAFVNEVEFSDEELESLMEKEVQDRATKDIHKVTVTLSNEEETARCAELLTNNGYNPEVVNK